MAEAKKIKLRCVRRALKIETGEVNGEFEVTETEFKKSKKIQLHIKHGMLEVVK